MGHLVHGAAVQRLVVSPAFPHVTQRLAQRSVGATPMAQLSASGRVAGMAVERPVTRTPVYCPFLEAG